MRNDNAFVFPILVARDDNVRAVRQGRATIAQDRLKGFPAHDERVPLREVAESLYVLGNLPQKPVPFPEFPIPPYRYDRRNYRLFHTSNSIMQVSHDEVSPHRYYTILSFEARLADVLIVRPRF